jgi:pyridoxine 4-dehydrogenase
MAWGPPKDQDAAASVLRAVVDLGITHIDTSDYYGPRSVNELIRETLHPYPAGLHIVTKVGARRGPDKTWPAALNRDELVQAVHDNLKHLGLESLDLVNPRMTDSREADAITGPFSVLAALQQEGLIKHLGVSNVSVEQVAAGTSSAAHLRENAAAVGVDLPAEAVTALNAVGTADRFVPWGKR